MMKCIASVALFFVAFTVVVPLAAQEPPEKKLEFVRNLREKGYADLAFKYLKKIAGKEPTIPQLVEFAKTRVAMASRLPAVQQNEYLAKAREDLQVVIKKNPTNIDGMRARLEVARLAMMEGKNALNQALREEEQEKRDELSAEAQKRFVSVGQDLEAAIKLLTKLSQKYADSQTTEGKLKHEQLEDARLQAMLDRGIAYIEEARSYINYQSDEQENLKRAKVIQKARGQFKELTQQDADSSKSWMGVAWLIRAHQLAQDPGEAHKMFLILKRERRPVARDAQRWGDYFFIAGLLENPTYSDVSPIKKLEAKINLAKEWFENYPAHHKSPEGYGVRYELASAYHIFANTIKQQDKEGKLKEQAQEFLNKAKEQYDKLADTDSAQSGEAARLSFRIAFNRMGKDTPIYQLKSFEDCYIKARYEMYLMRQANGKLANAVDEKEKTKYEQEREQHLENVVNAFKRSLQFKENDTPIPKLIETRYYLTSAYLMRGDHFRAALCGELLGKEEPPTHRSADAAGYALNAYSRLYAEESDDENKQRLYDMAKFILEDRKEQWAEEAVVPVARYRLASMDLRAGNLKEAIAHFAQLPKSYPAYYYSQAQLVFAAAKGRDSTKDSKERLFYIDAMRAALKRIPKLPNDIDSSSAAMYFFAHVEQIKMLYGEGARLLNNKKYTEAGRTFQEMAKYLEPLKKDFESYKKKFTQKTTEDVALSLRVMDKYTRVGLAESFYRGGNYKRVLDDDLTGSIVKQVRKLAEKSDVVKMKDEEVVGELLALAVRANVQVGNVEEGKAILALIRKMKGDGLVDRSNVVLRTLVLDLQRQVETLQESGQKKKLKVVIANFSGFLNELIDSKKGVQPRDVFFMAKAFASLDQHCKAAEMYDKMPVPLAIAEPERFKKEYGEHKATIKNLELKFSQIRNIYEDKLKNLRKLADDTQQKLAGETNEVTREALRKKLEAYETQIEKQKEPIEDAANKLQAAEEAKRGFEAHELKFVNSYWFAKIEQARHMRLCVLEKKEKPLKIEDLAEAKKILDEILANELAKGKIRAQKELNHIYEDIGHYGTAATKWINLMNSPAVKQNLNIAEIRNIYFQSYLHFLKSLYLYGKQKGDQRYMRSAATKIARMEESENKLGWETIGQQLMEFMDEEPMLKKYYMEQKSK